MSTRGYSGKYSPKNPEKYIGNVTEIWYRSLLEKSCMVFFDTNPNILKWNSEEVVVQYVSPIDNKVHRYFIDFYIEFIDKSGQVKKQLIEVKPSTQVVPPKQTRGKKKERYAIEMATYLINCAKWQAAQKFCEGTEVTFKLLTEKEIRRDKANK